MSLSKSVLVVANVTAASDELCERLAGRAAETPTEYTLLVPATSAGGGSDLARETLERAVSRLRDAGLTVEGLVGDPDPVLAVADVWDPRRFDEIVVSTLPLGSSQWQRAGLPQRIHKLTDAIVTHIVCSPPKPPPRHSAPPRHDDWGLGPLEVLGWGGRRTRTRQ